MFKFIISPLILLMLLVQQVNVPYVIKVDSIIQTATAQEPEVPPFETNAKALAAYGANAAPVITYDENTVWPMASLTKMMSAMVFFEQKPNLKQPITLEQSDMVGGGMIKVPVGTRMSAEDVIHATLMVSANNTAHALYKATPLTMDQFVEKMNEHAQALGLTNTHFVDPTGLDPGNVSTPREYAKIMETAMNIPEIAQIMGKSSYAMDPIGKKGFGIGTTNRFFTHQTATDFTVIGAKTGILNESGINLAVQAKKNDKKMTAVVFGEGSIDKAFADAQQLLDKAFQASGK